MTYEVGYIDGLAGNWVAGPTPTTTAPVVPYRRGRDGGMAYQAPRNYQPAVGNPTSVLDRALDAETYTTPSGTRAWRPTAAENALVDAVTANPYSGLDELAAAGGRGAVAGRGIRNLPYVGDVAGGVVEGAQVYGNTGSVTHGVFAGGGSAIGGVAGTAVGGALGAVGGPVGVAVGGVLGGAVGGAVGSAIGQALADALYPLPPANNTGAGTDTGITPFIGGQSAVRYYVTYQYNTVLTSGDLREPPSQQTATAGGNGYMGPIVRAYGAGSPQFQTVRLTYEGGASDTGVRSGSCAQGCYRNIKIVSVTRVDGQPDTGGNPPNLTEPYRPTSPTPLIPRIPGFGLPRPTRPEPRTRPSRPTESPSTDPFGNPTGAPIDGPGPIGVPQPITGAPGGGITGAPGDYPSDGPHDDPYPTGDPANPNPVEQPGPNEEPCDPCVELRQIKEKLNETFTLAWSLPDCGQSFTVNKTGEKEGKGLKGLSEQIQGLYQVLKVIHDKTRCESEPFLVVPDSWPMKVESGRPQLVLVYADKKPDRSWGRLRYEFCIPHFDAKLRNALKSLVPKEIKKGSHQGTYTLADNSKIITYCQTKTEAMRVIKSFDKLVLKGMRTNNQKTGEINPNTQFAQITLYPYQARYFSQGQHKTKPDWLDLLY